MVKELASQESEISREAVVNHTKRFQVRVPSFQSLLVFSDIATSIIIFHQGKHPFKLIRVRWLTLSYLIQLAIGGNALFADQVIEESFRAFILAHKGHPAKINVTLTLSRRPIAD